MFPFELTRPWALALLLIALPVLILFFVRSLSDFPRLQRKISLMTRCLILSLLTLALAGFVWLQETDEQFFIFLVDQSNSVGASGQEKLDEILIAAKESVGESRVAFLPFASTTRNVQQTFGESETDSSEGTSKTPTTQSQEESPDTDGLIASAEQLTAEKQQQQFADGTNIAAAIEAAAGYLPPDYVPRIVLLTDGNQTQGGCVGGGISKPRRDLDDGTATAIRTGSTVGGRQRAGGSARRRTLHGGSRCSVQS